MQIVVKKREEQLRIIFINHAVKDYNLKCIVPLLHGRLRHELVETVKDFLTELDIKPSMHLVKIGIFSLNKVTNRLTKIMNNLFKHLKILIFKVIFQCQKLSESSPNFFSSKNIGLDNQLLIKNIFEDFHFENTSFPKSVPNFCRLCSQFW